MQKVLIIGSSSGIGRSITSELVRDGASVWGVARSEQTSIQKETESLPGKFRFSQCDVASWEAISKLAEEVKSAWGSVDALICASGIQGSMGPAMAADPLEWQNTVHSNLNGTFFAIRAFYSLLLKSKSRSKVICFSGGGATGSRPNFSAYAAAKTGIVRLVEVLADEWKKEPIDINSIAPGAIYTRMTDEVLALGPQVVGEKEYESAVKVKQTGGGSTDKITGLVRFLLSRESDHLSGRLLAAQWDGWDQMGEKGPQISRTEAFTLRRVLPEASK